MRVIPNPALEKPIDMAIEKVGSKTMETTEKVISKEQRNCLLSDKLIEMFVFQLQSELANHNLYRTFANYFNSQGLVKLTKYFNSRADEEWTHHLWIYDYLNECNAVFPYPDIAITKIDIKDNLVPFTATVDVEIETTGSIYNIMNQAKEEGDYITVNFLNEAGKLIPEQLEEQKLSMDVLNIAKQDTDWLTKQDSIYELYYKQI